MDLGQLIIDNESQLEISWKPICRDKNSGWCGPMGMVGSGGILPKSEESRKLPSAIQLKIRVADNQNNSNLAIELWQSISLYKDIPFYESHGWCYQLNVYENT